MIHCGDSLTVLRGMPAESVQCCVTSPPYWGLRDYGHAGQLGIEKTPEEYVARMVEVFREVRRVLADDGTLWLNLGDSYASTSGLKVNHPQQSRNGPQGVVGPREKHPSASRANLTAFKDFGKYKPKDLVGIPWRVAFALQADGWYLRSDIIWHKPNPMPESVTDRPTKAHEYIFLMSKSERYFYDAKAIAEPITESSVARLSQNVEMQEGSDRVPGKTNGTMKAVGGFKQDGHGRRHAGFNARWDASDGDTRPTRNARTVWTIATQPYAEAHFATFPEEIPMLCIRAGSKPWDTVLDPFSGAGTVGVVCEKTGRRFIGIELNPEYVAMAERRIYGVAPLFAGTEA